MLEIEELAGNTITSADVAAITPEIIAEAFTEIAHKGCVFEQFYKPNRDILNKPGKQVVFPGAKASGGFTIGVPENTDIRNLNASIGIEKYTGTTIAIEKVGGYLNITRESIKYSLRDVIKDNIYEVGLQYKEAIDDMAYYQMMFGAYKLPSETSTTITAGNSIAALTGPVLNISSISFGASTLRAIDYANGSIYLTATLAADATIWYYTASKPGLAVNSAQPESTSTGVTAWGILSGKTKMVAQGRNPKVVVMSDNDVPNLLYDEKVNFLSADAYGGREPLMNAEIGKLWGLKVVTESRHLPDGAAILIDTDRMGYNVYKEELEVYRDPAYERDAVSYYAYAERGFGVKDTLALCLVLGGTSKYKGTHPVE